MLNSVTPLQTLDLLHCYWQLCAKVLFAPKRQICTFLWWLEVETEAVKPKDKNGTDWVSLSYLWTNVIPATFLKMLLLFILKRTTPSPFRSTVFRNLFLKAFF